MVNLYATLIINKRRTFDQVPEKFKADVEAKLLEYGYDAGRRTFNQVPAKFKAAVKADLEALGLDENGNPVD